MLKHALVLAVLFGLVLVSPVSARPPLGENCVGCHPDYLGQAIIDPAEVVEMELRGLKLVRRGHFAKMEVFTCDGAAWPSGYHACTDGHQYSGNEMSLAINKFIAKVKREHRFSFKNYRIFYCKNHPGERHITGVTITLVTPRGGGRWFSHGALYRQEF